MPTVRVLLVAEERLLADALSERLSDESDLLVVTEDGSDRAHLERTVARVRPAVVVASGLAVGRAVLEVRAGLNLVVLAPSAESSHAVAAARAGAIAWLPMSSSVEQLVEVIRSAAAGQAHYPGEQLLVVLRELRRDASRARGPGGPLDLLSDREIDVLGCLSEGQSNKEIARTLSMSGNTARTHVRNIFRKLDVHSRLEAVRVARMASDTARGATGVLRPLSPSDDASP